MSILTDVPRSDRSQKWKVY